MIVGGAPGQVLAFVQFVLRFVVIFVMRDGVLFVDRAQETKQTLAVFFRAVAKNLVRRLLCMFAINANRARRALESSQAGLLYRHESYRSDADNEGFIFFQRLANTAGDRENLICQRNARCLFKRISMLLDGFLYRRPKSVAIKKRMRTVDMIFQFISALQK